VARTYFVNPTKEQEETYEVLLSAFDRVIEAMKPGATLSSVYNTAVETIKAKNPLLVPHFMEDCGSSVCLEKIQV
jgi:nucleosome binding factor SPN SPT16 subunit